MKYVSRSYVLVIQYKFLYSLCLLVVYGIPHEISLIMLARNDKFLTVLHPSFSNAIVQKFKIMDDLKEIMVDNSGYCMNAYLYNKETHGHDLESLENYDTLTQNDVVRTQYMKLPYPAVSQQQLSKEKAYYYTHRKIPYTYIPGLTFEALNHYLYKGRNTFR